MIFLVEVISYKTGEVVHRIPCGQSERRAEQVERGVNINISEEYYTRIVTETTK